MRNLKRALSLALSALMLVGMMVVGTSAASFPDVKATDNQEAIAVVKAVSIFDGDENGNFNPDQKITRNEMAVVMCKLLDLNPDDYAGTCKFTDVPDWAKNYVAACNAKGIVSGTSATTYGGEGNVIAVDAALMVLKALGYFQYNSDFGSDYQLAAVTKASEAKLFKGISSNAKEEMTRNDVAQIVLNGLKAPTVKATGSDGVKVEAGGAVVTTGSTISYEKVTTTDGYKNAISNAANASGDVYLELGEKLYEGTLKKEAATVGGLEGYVFTYKGDEITSFASSSDVLATSHNGTDFAKLITKGKTGYVGKADSLVEIYVNGVQSKTDTSVGDPANANANGEYVFTDAADLAALTTVGQAHDEIGTVIEFIDTDDDDLYNIINITEYTMSKVTKTTAEKSDGTEATVTVTGIGTVKESEVTGAFAGLAKDDYVMYAQIKSADGTETDTYMIYELTTFTGAMTRKTSDNTLTVGGSTYKASAAANRAGFAQAQAYSSNNEGTFYVDANGYIVAVDAVETEAKYAVVDKLAYVASGTASGYAEAVLVFTDGSKQTVKVDKFGGTAVTQSDTKGTAAGAYSNATVANAVTGNTAFAGLIYTYKTDSDGNYELTQASGATADAAMTKGTVSVGSTTANGDTLYIYKTVKNGDDVFTVYTGYQNAPSTAADATISVVAKDGYAKFVYVDATSTTAGDSETSIIVFLSSDYATEQTEDDDTLYIYKAAVDGSVGDYTAENPLTFDKFVPYAVNVDSDGYIDDIEGAGSGAADHNFKNDTDTLTDYVGNVVAAAAPKSGTLKIVSATINGAARTSLTYDGEEKVYVVDSDNKDVYEGTINDIVAGTYFYVDTVGTDTDAKKVAIKTLYVITGSEDATVATASLTLASDGNTVAVTDMLSGSALTVTGAAATEKVKVTPTISAGQYAVITISGAGTEVSYIASESTPAYAEYTLVAGDGASSLNVTVVSYEYGKAPLTQNFTISINAFS